MNESKDPIAVLLTEQEVRDQELGVAVSIPGSFVLGHQDGVSCPSTEISPHALASLGQ